MVDTIDDSVTGSFQQVDLYRHLEEVAKKIESILIVKLQEYAFASAPQHFAKFVLLLDLWENYVISLENTEGEFHSQFVFHANSSKKLFVLSIFQSHYRLLHLQNCWYSKSGRCIWRDWCHFC